MAALLRLVGFHLSVNALELEHGGVLLPTSPYAERPTCQCLRIGDTAAQKSEAAPVGSAPDKGLWDGRYPGCRRRARRHQEIREPAALQHRLVLLRHARASREMVKQGVDFVVSDAKTNEDITRTVLTQIIFEEESREGQNLLPIQFLRQLIGFYGNPMQAFLPSYLEMSLATFAQQQERCAPSSRQPQATARAWGPATRSGSARTWPCSTGR